MTIAKSYSVWTDNLRRFVWLLVLVSVPCGADGLLRLKRIKAGCEASLTSYFVGTPEQREEHAKGMDEAGRFGAKQLLERYSGSAPARSPVLEIGPFLNPLGADLENRGPWVVWELDGEAAHSAVLRPQSVVFNGDLNPLDQREWDEFLRENRKAVHGDPSRRVGFGTVVLSSVLNYLDYKLILDKVINEMAEGGLLVIGNANVGDVAMMRNKRAVLSSQILEYLLLNFGDRIEILEGSRYSPLGFDVGRTGIRLALKVHSKPRDIRPDLYQFGLGLWTDYTRRPYQVTYADRTDDRVRAQEFVTHWLSTDPQVVATALQDIESNKLERLLEPKLNRAAEMQHTTRINRNFIDRVANAEPGDIKDLSNALNDSLFAQRFLPEREILGAALQISDKGQRRQFLRTNLEQVYLRLGHIPGANL